MIKKLLISIPFFSALGRSCGMLIPFFIAFAYGVSHETDTFFFVFSLYAFITSMLVYVFESVFVPYLVEQKTRSEDVFEYGNSILFCMVPVLFLLGLIAWIFIALVMPKWSAWDSSQILMTRHIFLILIPFIFLATWSAQINALFYTHKSFVSPAFLPFIRSSIIIIFILLLSRKMGIYALPYGYVVGEMIRCLVGVLILRRNLNWHLKINFKKFKLLAKQFSKKIGLWFLALVAANSIFSVDLWFASRLGEGDVSLFSYADRLVQIPFLLFQTGFLHIFHSFWSESYFTDSSEQFWTKLKKESLWIIGVTVAVIAALFIFKGYIIDVIYGSANFSDEQLTLIKQLTGYLLIYLVPAVIRTLYIRVLFVLKKIKIFLFVSWFYLFSKIILNTILTQKMGVLGLTVSSVFVMSLTAIGLYFYMKRISKPKEGCS